MSKEVKNQEPETTKSSKKYIALAIVVILGAIGIMMNNGSEEETTVPATIAKTEKLSVSEKIIIDEKEPESLTVARIDMYAPQADKPQFEAYLDDNTIPLKEADWMQKYKRRGIVVSKSGYEMDVIIKAFYDAKIDVVFMGPYEMNAANQIVEKWVKYTSIAVDGEEILAEPVNVWHNKPFIHTINAKADEEYKIHVEWQKPDTIPEK